VVRHGPMPHLLDKAAIGPSAPKEQVRISKSPGLELELAHHLIDTGLVGGG
jgi:hypothetical protein